jgi:transposase InsO family protein
MHGGPIIHFSYFTQTFVVLFRQIFWVSHHIYLLLLMITHESFGFIFLRLRMKPLISHERGCKIKCLRSDHGGEYFSKYSHNCCDMNVIKRQLTTAYTPQQTGVAERKKHSMVEMERSMLQTKGLSNSFWGDAIATYLYILNICPTSLLDMMTPYEASYEKNPNVNHFRVFGCVAYVHVVD